MVIANRLILVGLLATMTICRVAHSTCGGGPNDRRAFVAQPPDIFFTAGVASTQYIPEVFVNYNNIGEPFAWGDDCGISAGSTISGVSVQETYCNWNLNNCLVKPSGQYAGVDHATGFSSPAVYRSYETDHVRPVPVIYDGTAPAGTNGTVDYVFLNDAGQVIRILAQVNVHIVAGTPPPTWFTATSSASNISGDSFSIDNAWLNGDSTTKVFITHYWGGTYWNHPTAVTYDVSTNKWRIRNEDGATMPVGMVFNVHVDPTALRIQTARSGAALNYLIINDPASNGNPYATILATARTQGNRRMAHPLAVSYVSPYWRVITADGATMPVSDLFGNTVAFEVKLIGASQYADDNLTGDASGFTNTLVSNGAGTDINGPFRISGSSKFLSDFCWANDGLKPLIVTANQTPLPLPAPHNYTSTDPKYVGVWANGPYNAIYHEDNSAMAGSSAFNVWAPYDTSCAPH
ncbi:MAG: hypothetical protein JWO36_2951 [Myxococcales bacterium]|nr:hypothetical protein [Myxococcales bacterium]